jgi:hypothetical protein
MKQVAYLVIKANQTMRVVRRLPDLSQGEVAIRLNLIFPDTWGRIVDTVEVTIPDFTPTLEVDEGDGP